MAKDLTATTLNSFRRHGLTQAAFLLPNAPATTSVPVRAVGSVAS